MLYQAIILGCTFVLARAEGPVNQASLPSPLLCGNAKFWVYMNETKVYLGTLTEASSSLPLIDQAEATFDKEVQSCEFADDKNVLFVTKEKNLAVAELVVNNKKYSFGSLAEIKDSQDTPANVPGVAAAKVTLGGQDYVYVIGDSREVSKVTVYTLGEGYVLTAVKDGSVDLTKVYTSAHFTGVVEGKPTFIGQTASGMFTITITDTNGVPKIDSEVAYPNLQGQAAAAYESGNFIGYNTYFATTDVAYESAVLLKKSETNSLDFLNVARSISSDLGFFKEDVTLAEELKTYDLKIGKSSVNGYWLFNLASKAVTDDTTKYNVTLILSDGQETPENKITITITSGQILVDLTNAVPWSGAETTTTIETQDGAPKLNLLLDAKTLYISTQLKTSETPVVYTLAYSSKKALTRLQVGGEGTISAGSEVKKVQGATDKTTDPWKGFGVAPALGSVVAAAAAVLLAFV